MPLDFRQRAAELPARQHFVARPEAP